MIVIGIDPGKTIGLVLYDSDAGLVIAANECTTAIEAERWAKYWYAAHIGACIAIEWPRVYGIGGNEIADTCAQAGWLWGQLGGVSLPAEGGSIGLRALTRTQVVAAISQRLGQQVRGDAGVWAAIVELHGGHGIADRRITKMQTGGPLAKLAGKPHAKAALAVAFAAALGAK